MASAGVFIPPAKLSFVRDGFAASEKSGGGVLRGGGNFRGGAVNGEARSKGRPTPDHPIVN